MPKRTPALPMPRAFPGLSDALQGVAEYAKREGFALTQYNSGVRNNPLNGIRIHRASQARQDYFSGDHLRQFSTVAEVEAWLDGAAYAFDYTRTQG